MWLKVMWVDFKRDKNEVPSNGGARVKVVFFITSKRVFLNVIKFYHLKSDQMPV